jgi:hypothetical protein
MTNSYNILASTCRKQAKDTSVRHYSDSEIDQKIKDWERKYHSDIDVISAFTEVDNPIDFSVARLAIICGVTSDILSSIEGFEADASAKLEAYNEYVEKYTQNKSIFVSGGHNLADELEPLNYTAVQSETTPDIGVDNGLLG